VTHIPSLYIEPSKRGQRPREGVEGAAASEQYIPIGHLPGLDITLACENSFSRIAWNIIRVIK
jgi:hypothetical protein